MILAIAKNEFLQFFRSHKLTITMLVCCTLMPSSIFVMLLDYDQAYANYVESLSRDNPSKGVVFSWEEQSMYSFFLYPDSGSVKKLNRLSVFDKGIEGSLSGTFRLFGPWLELTFGVRQERNVFASLFGSFDLLLVTKLAIGLLAIVLGCSSIVSEREAGTLALILTNKIGRAQFMIGKFIGGVSVVLGSYIAGLILCLILLTAWPSWAFTTADFIPVLLIFITFIIYVIFSYLLGMAISSLCKTTATASIAAVVTWLSIIVLLPLLLIYCAEIVRPVLSSGTIQLKKINAARDILEDAKPHFEIGGTTMYGLPYFNAYWGGNMDYKIAEAVGNIEDEYFREEQRQIEFATSLLMFTPSGALTNTVDNLVGTSQRNYLAYKKAALSTRDILYNRLFPTIDQLKAIGRGDLDPRQIIWNEEPTEDYIKSLELDKRVEYFLKIPIYDHTSRPWRTTLDMRNSVDYDVFAETEKYVGNIESTRIFAVGNLVSLIIVTFVFLGISFCLVMRYDVRP